MDLPLIAAEESLGPRMEAEEVSGEAPRPKGINKDTFPTLVVQSKADAVGAGATKPSERQMALISGGNLV